MKKYTDQQLEDALHLSRPPEPRRGLSANFSDDLLQNIRQQTTRRPAVTVSHNSARTGSIHLWQRLALNLRHMPRLAAIALLIGSTGALGGVSYAAYHWIKPHATITDITSKNDDNKRQFTLDAECGEFNSGKDLKFEIAQNSNLTDADATKVFENTCAYDAMQTGLRQRWESDNDQDSMARKKPGDTVTIYEFDNVFIGSTENNPIFGLTIGTVTALSDTSITIEARAYTIDHSTNIDNPFEYYPEGKMISRTIPINSDVEVTQDNGEALTLANIHLGDQVQLVNAARYAITIEADGQHGMSDSGQFGVAAIIKTQLDLAYIRQLTQGLGNPDITNRIAALIPCDNNPGLLCPSLPTQILATVYTTMVDSADGGINKKYLRSDSRALKSREIAGRITAITGKTMTFETRGTKQQATITYPVEVLDTFDTRASFRGTTTDESLRPAVGDMLNILYVQAEGEDPLVIKPGDITNASLLEYVTGTGVFAKY